MAIVRSLYFCRLVTSRTSINQLLILRLVVHPTIWSILILQFSNTVRHIGESPALCNDRHENNCCRPDLHVLTVCIYRIGNS